MSSSFIQPAEGVSTPQANNQDVPSSPVAPPYSPITPPLEAQQLPPLESKDEIPKFMEKPPEPVNLDMVTNTDAMALRAALLALQVQRMNVVDDMKLLEQQKRKALSDPKRFAHGIMDGSIKVASQPDILSSLRADSETEASQMHREGDENNQGELEDRGRTRDIGDEPDQDAAPGMVDVSSDEAGLWQPGTDFGTIPKSQNIVRMPAINWAKYHIVGEPLEAMHREQNSKPDPGQNPKSQLAQKAQPHVVAAPYSPWNDKLPESSTRTKK